MTLTVNAAHVLDDYLETIETSPSEIKTQLESLAAKDSQFEEARKALFKKRNLYLRAEEKGLDATLQAALLRKTEKEHSKLLTIIDEKLEVEGRLTALVEQHLSKLEEELSGKLGMNMTNPFASVFSDIPDADRHSLDGVAASALLAHSRSRSSPKKRQTLADEPIDPNEPVYCYCKQVSYGDMIGCDNPECPVEWFHYQCVGLSAPPKGKWFCKECSQKNFHHILIIIVTFTFPTAANLIVVAVINVHTIRFQCPDWRTCNMTELRRRGISKESSRTESGDCCDSKRPNNLKEAGFKEHVLNLAPFKARKSILDREDLNVGGPPMRGFFALFWITIFLYAANSVYQNHAKHFMGISLRLWQASYSDFEALLVMIAAIYLYAHIAVPYQIVITRGWVKVERGLVSLTLRLLLQNGPIMMAIFVARYRSWPHLQTGSLLLFSIVMSFKMHSYLSTNMKLYKLWLQGKSPASTPLTSLEYPHNLTLTNYTCFLWYPTLIYQLGYPRSERIRVGYLLERTAGVIVIFVLFYLVASHYVYPVLLSVDERPTMDILVDLVLPCLTCALLFFFLVFEYLLNWAAEVSYFADRHFYADWWNSTDLAEFARKWNVPVHKFLQHHIYLGLQEEGYSEFFARFMTFLFSSIFHEIVMSCTAKRLKFWILTMQMSQLPLTYLTKAIGLRQRPFLANCIWWLMIILGIPILILLYSRDVNLALFTREIKQFSNKF